MFVKTEKLSDMGFQLAVTEPSITPCTSALFRPFKIVSFPTAVEKWLYISTSYCACKGFITVNLKFTSISSTSFPASSCLDIQSK